MPTAQQAEPQLVNKLETARLIGVSRYTIMRAVKAGVIREVTIAPGMRPMLRRSDVLALARGDTP